MADSRRAARVLSWALCALALAGCKPLPAEDADSAALGEVAPIGDSGESLVSACTPTGPELCFNAIDDNCNGIIDEGCGLHTGPLQFTVAWGDSPADIDLVVIDPRGTRVFEGNRSAASGLRLDHDCPSDGCGGQNVENVYFDGAEPPPGRYHIEIKLAELKGASSPVRCRFGARIGSRSYGSDVLLSHARPRKTFRFEL